MAISVKVNNVDVTSSTLMPSLRFSNKGLAASNGVCSFSIRDLAGTLSILPEHPVIVADGATTIFNGRIRNRQRTIFGSGSGRKKGYAVTAEDMTTYLVDDVCDTGALRTTSETDKDRIEWLLTTFGTKGIAGGATVQNVGGTLANDQDFTGMTLYEAINEVAKLGGGKFYVDFSAYLHYFTTETNPAAWNLSDSPNGTTTFGYDDLQLPDDTHDLVNAVFVIGVDGLTPEWRTDATSIAAYGRREMTLRDSTLDTQAALFAAGDALLAKQKNPRGAISLRTYTPGLKAGMTVTLTNSTWGISAVIHPITQVDMSIVTGSKTFPVYAITLDDSEVTIGSVIGAGTTTASNAYSTAQQAAAATKDLLPPAVPTGLTLTTDTALDNNGTAIVRIIATLDQTAQYGSLADYFGCYVELTRDNDGDDTAPTPVWTQPMKLLLGEEVAKVAFEGVAGNTKYWGRAYSVDTSQNTSDYGAVVSVVTSKDSTAPGQPQGVVAVGGFRGVALKWLPSSSADLMFVQVRWGTTGSAWPGLMNTGSTVVWVPDLTPDVLHYFQVRSVDESGNTVTSSSDATAVDYLANPDAGWTTSVTATPALVGGTGADIASYSITTTMVSTSGLSADVIKSGKVTLRTPGYAGADALEVRDAANVLLGKWSPAYGIVIYGANGTDRAELDDGYLRFYKAGVTLPMAEIGPDGIVANSIRVGALAGGHNVLRNSSFELASGTAGTAWATFTDNTGTPGWKAANRTTTPDNMTEGATLTPTTMSY